MKNETILVVDFGGQYNQLIARRVRECNVYCEVHPYNKVTADFIRDMAPIGIIFTGGPNSVYAKTRRISGKKFFRSVFRCLVSATARS